MYAASDVYVELWVSLASLLRSYTAAHGLNGKQQATVEVGEDTIMVRTGTRWLRLDRTDHTVHSMREDGDDSSMDLTIDGRLRTKTRGLETEEVELDMQAEAWARELML